MARYLTCIYFLIILFIASCKSDPTCKDTITDNALTRNPAFAAYVTSYSGGTIGRKESIEIELAHPIADSSLWGKPTDTDLLSIKPEVKGVLRWVNANTLRFTPDAALPYGTSFEANLEIGKLYDIPDQKLRNFNFNFYTTAAGLTFKWGQLLTPAGGKATAFASIITNDFQEPELVEKAVKLATGSAETIWAHSPDGKEHLLKIANIDNTAANPFNLAIDVDGEPLGIDGSKRFNLEIPTQGSFAVGLVECSEQNSQNTLEVYFTQDLDPNQNIADLISTGNGPHILAPPVIEGNKITLFTTPSSAFNLTIKGGVKSISQEVSTTFVSDVNTEYHSLKSGISVKSNGFITPNTEGAVVLAYYARGVAQARIDVIAYPADKVNELMLREITSDYQTGGHRFYGNYLNLGQPVMSKIIALNEKQTLTEQTDLHQLDLSDLVGQYPNHLFKVFIKPESSETNSQVWLNRRFDPANPDHYDEDVVDYIYNYWKSLFSENGASQNNDGTIYKFGYDYYESEGGIAQAFILNSNIGLNCSIDLLGKVNILTTDLVTGEAKDNTSITCFDRYLNPITTLTTDAEGHAYYDGEKHIALIKATDQQHATWLPIKDIYKRNLSNYNVGYGYQNFDVGLRGMVYAERGFYYPGDSVYATLLIQEPNQLKDKAQPVIMSIKDASGNILSRSVKAYGQNGFFTFKLAVPVNERNGTHFIEAEYAGSRFRKSFLVGKQMPNRMNISLEPKVKSLFSGQTTAMALQANYLFGAPASNSDFEISANATPSIYKPIIPQLRSFSFRPEKFAGAPLVETVLTKGKLNAAGFAEPTVTYQAPGDVVTPLDMVLKTTVAEASGETSVDTRDITCHTQPYYLGINAIGETKGKVNAQNQYVENAEVIIEAALVNPLNNQMVNAGTLTATLLVRQETNWYEVSESSGASYQTANTQQPIDKITLALGADGIYRGQFARSNSNHYNFEVLVEDLKTHQKVKSEIKDKFANTENVAAGEQNRDPRHITFGQEPLELKVGENKTIKLPADPEYTYHISVETHAEVIRQFWLKKGDNSIDLKPEASWAPGVYVHVSAYAPFKTGNSWSPLRKYGLLHFKVTDPSGKLEPLISLPESAKPGDNLTIKVAEKNNRKMTYTLAIVDEGLLNISRYKTPDPFERFNQISRYGIQTFDMYDDVLRGDGIFPIKYMLKPGGDEYLNADAALKNQRFKPVVAFLGPFTTNGETQTHQYSIPNYFGQLRVMVIAGAETAFGAAEKNVTIKADLMASLFGPTVAGPSESVQIPLTLFIQNKDLKAATLTIKSSNGIQVNGATTRTIALKGPGSQVEMITIKTDPTSGSKLGVLTAIAKSGNNQSVTSLKLPIRQGNLPIEQLHEFTVAGNKTYSQQYGYAGLGANASLLLSNSVVVDWATLAQSAITEPLWNCESAAALGYRQLLLAGSGIPAVKPYANLLRVYAENNLAYISRFKLAGGLYCNYRNSPEPNLVASLAVYQFMVAARDFGFNQDEEEISQLGRKLKQYILNMGTSKDQAMRGAFMALLAEVDPGQYEISNTFREQPVKSRLQLAVLSMVSEATSNPIKPIDNSTLGYFGGLPADIGLSLETVQLLTKVGPGKTLQTVKDLASKLEWGGYYNLWEQNYILKLLLAYQKVSPTNQPIYAQAQLGAKSYNIKTLAPTYQINQGLTGANFNLVLTNNHTKPLSGQLKLSGIPPIGKEVIMADGIHLSTSWADGNAQLVAGERKVLQITIGNTTKGSQGITISTKLLIPTGFDVADDLPNQNGVSFIRQQDVITMTTTLSGDKETSVQLGLTPRLTGQFRLAPLVAKGKMGRFLMATTKPILLNVSEHAKPGA